VAFIAGHVDARHEDADGPGLRWGVESICKQLTVMGCKIAPASYYEHRSRTPSTREVRDADLKPKITAAHAANYGVFGARKVWLTLNRQRAADEPAIARCTVERLMGELRLAGAVRGKVKRTTISNPRQPKPHDLVNRNFRPLAPDRLWVADVCLYVVGLVLHRVRHRRLRPTDLGLVGCDHDDQPARRRRPRPSRLDTAPRRQRPNWSDRAP
jgi:putative transposase